MYLIYIYTLQYDLIGKFWSGEDYRIKSLYGTNTILSKNLPTFEVSEQWGSKPFPVRVIIKVVDKIDLPSRDKES